MRLLAIDDLDLRSLNLYELPLVTSKSISMEFAVRRRAGELGSMFVGNAPADSRWMIQFRPDDHAARDAIMAAIVSDMTSERRLVAERLDANRTRVVASAAVAYVEPPINELDFVVAFEGSDSVWRSEAEATTAKTFANANDLALHVDVPGNATAYPTLRITPTVQRASGSVYAGWKWRRRYRVQNNGDVPWFRHPVRIDLGSTTALTPTKAQAGGDDVRVWLHGIEQPRTLVAWDTSASYVWVLVPNLPEGEYLDFDVVYGNPSATNPPVLAYPDVPAFDLATSDNDSLVWRSDPDDVADVGEGLFYLSETTWPFSVDYGTPGSWRPVVTMQDDENPDLSGVTNSTFRESQGNNAWASMSIIRVPADIEVFEQIQWRINGYDGMAFSWPLPIEAITATVGTALSSVDAESVVLLCRDSSADPWSLANSTSAGGDLTLSSFDLFRPMRHIALALWPAPADQRTNLDASLFGEGDYVAASLTTDVTVEIDDSDLSIAWLGNLEEEIYELAGESRIGGGSSRQAPYHALLLGNARQETGAGTPRLAVKLGNTLSVNCEDHSHVEYDATGAVVERASAHAVHGVQAWDLDGVAQEAGAVEWLPLSPGKIVVPNGAFAAGIQGWEADETTPGMTTTRTWSAGSIDGINVGALVVTVSPNSAGAESMARTINGKAFPVGARATIDLAATVMSANADLAPLLAVRFYDADGGLVATAQETSWIPVAFTPYRRAQSFAIPPNAVSYRIGLWAYAEAAGATGTVYFDGVTLNDGEVIFADDSIGQVAVEVGVKGAWLT